MFLDSVHPGVTVEQVLENTGWPLKVAREVKVTNPPLKEELKVLREEIDPKEIFLRKKAE
jgi:glutaconate CoA-transferase, subunit B